MKRSKEDFLHIRQIELKQETEKQKRYERLIARGYCSNC